MRREYAEGGRLADLVEWLATESLTGTGLDRRAAQRR
jgi:hypothetical protein